MHKYHEKLTNAVMDILKHYTDDFMVHDKEALRKAEEFFLFVRKSGTNTLVVSRTDGNHPAYGLMEEMFGVYLEYNTSFFYGCNGQVSEVSREDVLDYVHKHKRHWKQLAELQDTNIYGTIEYSEGHPLIPNDSMRKKMAIKYPYIELVQRNKDEIFLGCELQTPHGRDVSKYGEHYIIKASSIDLYSI